jgi:hypothetical protein
MHGAGHPVKVNGSALLEIHYSAAPGAAAAEIRAD